jgi:hypothetical protein
MLLWRREAGWVALHSGRDPMVEAHRWLVDAGFVDGVKAVIVIGAGLGYTLEAIEQRSPATRVLVFEPDRDCARAFLEARDWSSWFASGRLHLLVGPDYADRAGAWQALDDDGDPPIVQHPVLAADVPDMVAAAIAAAARLRFAAQANATARRENAGAYLLNTLRNVGSIAREADAMRLDGRFNGYPAIVISAGPSLDRNIDALRGLEHQAVLIAVDTALRPLLAAGVIPHLAVALDPTVANAAHLLHLPDASGVHLVAEASLHPDALAVFAGRTFLFQVGNHHPWPWLSGIGCGRVQLQVWGSVATAAFDLARRMRCDPVVLCGQDLAYTGGRSYCSGTTWDTWQMTGVPPPRVRTTDLHGREAATAAHLVSFRDWLIEQTINEPHRRFINASGDGILHGGRMEIVTLDHAITAGNGRGDDNVRHAIRAAYQVDGAIAQTAADVAAAVIDHDTIAAWQSFAGPRVNEKQIVDALRAGFEPRGRVAEDVLQAQLMDDLHQVMASVTPTRPACDRIIASYRQLARQGGWTETRVLSRRDLARLQGAVSELTSGRILVLHPGRGLTALIVGAAADPATTIEVQPDELCPPTECCRIVSEAARLAGVVDRLFWTRSHQSYDLVIVELGTPDAPNDSSDAVAMAFARVAAGGRLVVVDVSDTTAGTHVRRAVLSLAAPDVIVAPDVHAEWLTRLFIVQRLPVREHSTASMPPALTTEGDAMALARLLMTHQRPTTVLICGQTAERSAAMFTAQGITTHASPWAPMLAGSPPDSCGRYDIAVCLDALEHLPPDVEDAALQAITDASDTVVFTVPLPGLCRGSYPNQRAPVYWLERFLDRGYVFSDELRPLLEDRPDFTTRSFDMQLYAVRKLACAQARQALAQSPALREVLSATTARLEDVYLQAALLRLHRRDIATCTEDIRTLRSVPSANVSIPAADMTHADGHRFRVRFADTRARLCLRAGVLLHATIDEDGVPLPHAQMLSRDIAAFGKGRYWIGPEHLDLSSSDNTDPRTNGRTYSLQLPAHLARLASSF